jgi:membrane protein required for colicin V production
MAELSLTTADIVIIGVIAISAAFAMYRGLIHETFAILAWIVGGYAALRLTPTVQPLLHGAISPPWLEEVAVMIGIFLLIFIPLAILSGRLSAKVKSSMAGSVDRLLGLLFGIARGLAIVGLAYIAFSALVPLKDHPQTLTKARLFPLVRTTSEVLRSLAPEDIQALESEGKSSSDRYEGVRKTYGVNQASALERLFQGNGGSASSSR